jgi:hypothetical protein
MSKVKLLPISFYQRLVTFKELLPQKIRSMCSMFLILMRFHNGTLLQTKMSISTKDSIMEKSIS